MSLAAHFIHLCVIENQTTGAKNAYGNQTPAFETPINDVPCRFVEARERIWNDERGESVTVTSYKLFVMADVDLRDRSKISQITLEDGTTIVDTWNVREVYTRRGRGSGHHKMAVLERVS